ncbi:SUMF1/EgtB/PvdO family nonheme iron enzyme [Candidatus Thiosymbion oneisti]|uniref:SUMF1/EgtB/PvdO family nonheme iron enzyme n=1 Tax=Candidatus Thiosymbion oneisti TaxID=589554 RepID=UPI0015B67A0A|nr:SUMF1/EgtB/PvdO family nonheme iron enzyme [Candidatus Thiosymbion oneisti]
MTSPQLLARLSGLQQMMRDLLRGVPAAHANQRFDPALSSLGWYLGRSVYRESYWLREVLAGDTDLTDRVRPLFTPGAMDPALQSARLPPPAHLLNWAAQIQDEHLRRLATPGALPASDLLRNDRLQWLLLQEGARDYERMLMVLHAARMQQRDDGYRVERALTARIPAADLVVVEQGHYRIGSRDEPSAYDNELPPQAVELSGFRIAKRPVSNAEFLAFIAAGGYREDRFWSEEGRRWRDGSGAAAPLHWRRDRTQCWYGIGLQGPVDLQPDAPVAGLSRHEAQAFAAWVAGLDGDLNGAVLQHEYQWEVAARAGLIEGIGQVWEWCANPFHPYPEFRPFPDSSISQADFDGARFSLRGASLHTQGCLRRASFRNRAAPGDRQGFTGIRLVFPPK